MITSSPSASRPKTSAALISTVDNCRADRKERADCTLPTPAPIGAHPRKRLTPKRRGEPGGGLGPELIPGIKGRRGNKSRHEQPPQFADVTVFLCYVTLLPD